MEGKRGEGEGSPFVIPGYMSESEALKNHTPFSILQQSLIMAVKSISRSMSDSVLIIARLTSLPCVMDVWRRFSICLSLEKERSAIQLVTIKTKYIFSTIATILEKFSAHPY